MKMGEDCAEIQNKITSELDLFKAANKDFNKFLLQRQQLDGQLNENKCVLDELNILSPENKVYKLYGPVLVKQDLEESRQNVIKRMDYIKGELKRCNDTLDTLEKKQDQHREKFQKFQQEFQQASTAAAAAARK